jgi:hypothetical protein
MTLKLLLDTCVWLDLAKDYREVSVIKTIEELNRRKEIELIVPQQVLDEFVRNKERVAGEIESSLNTHFRVIKQTYRKFSGNGENTDFTIGLDDISFHLSKAGDVARNVLDRVEELLKSCEIIDTSSDVKLRVFERSIAHKAPYHRAKNSVGDAILIEIYRDLSATASEEHPCSFITLNIKDFSAVEGDTRQPHPDLAQIFSDKNSTYWTSVSAFLQNIFPEELSETESDEEYSFLDEVRRLPEILESENIMSRQVWYNRHCSRAFAIEEGRIAVVPESEYSRNPYKSSQILDSIWQGALASAKKTEEEIGVENLGPWTDFEWGMLNGKLSAIRWILGDEWDMLDT